MNSDYPLLYCQQKNIIIKFSQIYLVVDVVSTHSNGVHDKLAPLVITGSTISNVVRVMFCSKVMTQLMCGHQVCFLDTSRSHVVLFFSRCTAELWFMKIRSGKNRPWWGWFCHSSWCWSVLCSENWASSRSGKESMLQNHTKQQCRRSTDFSFFKNSNRVICFFCSYVLDRDHPVLEA